MPFFKSSVGLYIGPKVVQLAQVQAIAGKLHLTNFVHVDIQEDEQKADAGNKDDLIIAALRKAVFKAKVDLHHVTTVLMPGMVLLRYFQMPRISPEEMEEAVRFEARKYIPFRLEEAVTGFYILKDAQEERKMGILSLVTKEESIKHHLSVLSKVNVNPVAIETASFAIVRLLEHSQVLEKQKSNAVLYLYAQRMNIIILKSGVPYFVRDISLAKKEEWIDDDSAKFMAGTTVPSSADSRVVILENTISELRISLDYYKKELGKEEINKIIICGDIEDFDDLEAVVQAGQEKPDAGSPLAAYLEKKFGLPVQAADPLKNILSPKARPLPYTFPMLAVTLGAALRGLSKSTVEIDLFRARKKTSLKARYFVRKMAIGLASALGLSVAVMFILSSLLVAREKNNLESEKRDRPKFVDLSHFSDVQLVAGRDEIMQRMDVYKKLVKERLLLTPKLSVLPAVLAPDVWLKTLQYELAISVDKKKIAQTYLFDMGGFVFAEKKGMEVDAVNQFAEALKGNKDFFEGFKIIKTGQVSRAEFRLVPVMGFRLTCSSDVSQ